MALQERILNINFRQGVDTKTDPWQVPAGRFLSLVNSIFDKEGRLTKRNGFGALPVLPDSSNTYATTFNDNLLVLGDTLSAFSDGSGAWIEKGSIRPMSLSVLPTVRSNTNQSQVDSVVSANNLVCTVFTDEIPSGGSTSPVYKYVVADSQTGQNIIPPTVLEGTSGTVTGPPRVFYLGRYFVIVFEVTITATPHLQYLAISTADTSIAVGPTDITAQFTPNSANAFDGVVSNDRLYLAWNGSDMGGAIRMCFLTSQLAQSSVEVFAAETAEMMSVCADETGNTPIIYVSYYESSGPTGRILATDQFCNQVLAPMTLTSTADVLAITCAAQDGQCTTFYDVDDTYSHMGSVHTHYIESVEMTQAGVAGSVTEVVRSVGLASKAFIVDGNIYFLSIYSSAYQPTYFMIDSEGTPVAKLAYSNGGSYYETGLPSAVVSGSTVHIAYMIKDVIQAVNKSQGAANSSGVYSQVGLNLATFTISSDEVSTAEIGSNLHISGGFVWMFDGFEPVEHGFHLWPDYVGVTTNGAGGSITAQQYYYVATYEWSDNQGNIFRSAPSIPVSITTVGATSTNTITVPTLRITQKTTNPVKIVVYRWSAAQQTYYQITSITVPKLNSLVADVVTITDTQADSAIVGNNILYTTGGILENIAAPACNSMFLFNNRLFLIPAENQDQLWYSKQVIQGTPVETSDLLTLYVAPSTASQQSTGPLRCGIAMDDKAVLFKKNAIAYINGSGPDNTGANSQYSEPTYVTSTVGSDNPNSLVLIHNGIMFQSDKGIWLLGRDLFTKYIGAPVEDYTLNARVLTAVAIPGTNQVRFTMDSGVTLMFDYYFGQWSVFNNVRAISSVIYEDLHTYINEDGQVFQETPGAFLDGTTPVLMSFTTSWLNLAGLQGFQRAYFFYLLSNYLSPHKLNIQIAYDYNPSPVQSSILTPDNYALPYGEGQLWGSEPTWGGSDRVEQARIFLERQKCQAFQITVQEVFDGSYGTVPGEGLTMSGIELSVGIKSGTPKLRASKSVG